VAINIYAMLRLALPSIILRVGIAKRMFEQQPNVALEVLPVRRRGDRD
jgi:hypothetical protein